MTVAVFKQRFSFRLKNLNISFVKDNGSGSGLDEFLDYLRKNNLNFNDVIKIINHSKLKDEDYYFYLTHIKPFIEELKKLGLLRK